MIYKRLFLFPLLLCAMLTMMAQKNVTLMTYNIKGGGMTDTRLQNIAKVIKYNQPDVVAVQEVDNRMLGIFRHDYLKDLATATDMKYTFHPLVSKVYGIGLLFREEPISVEPKTFPRGANSKDREDRGIIIAEFKDYYFIGTHYPLDDIDRDQITSWIISFAKRAGKPVFVAGDFNAKPNYRAMRTFTNNGFKILNDVNQYTYPSDNPTGCIDMILFYDSAEEEKYEVEDSGVAPSGGVNIKSQSETSDHLPVFVQLKERATSGIDCLAISRHGMELLGNRVSNTGSKTTQVMIIDQQGRICREFSLQPHQSVDLSLSKRGCYILKARCDAKTQVIKFNYIY